MVKKVNKKITLFALASVLFVLNVFAFYVLQDGIGIAKAIRNTQNQEAIKALEKKQIFSDVFPSLVFTVDVALLFFVCYLLIKALFKSLRKPTSSKS